MLFSRHRTLNSTHGHLSPDNVPMQVSSPQRRRLVRQSELPGSSSHVTKHALQSQHISCYGYGLAPHPPGISDAQNDADAQ
jgi:hypothetical protein